MEHQQVVRRHDEGRVGAAFALPRPGPRMACGFVWWLFGLYALFWAQAPYTPSVQAEQTYREKMGQAIFSPEGRAAERRLVEAQRALNEVHVIGWRWRSPYSQLVPERQRVVDDARREFNVASAERDALISEAKAAVGIWSEHGITEVRERFWGDYQWGKDFAKRMTFWDVVFGRVGSRDEEMVVTLMRWAGQIMMNFTIGLFSALVSFFFSLFHILWVYKTSWLSGLLFFAVAMSAATAMVGAFVGGMVGTAVGGVYVLAQQAKRARLEGRGGQPRRYVHHQQRPHYQQPHHQHYD